MAAKLCNICGGSGKEVIYSFNSLNTSDVFADIPIISRCDECKGLGYIPIKKGVEK